MLSTIVSAPSAPQHDRRGTLGRILPMQRPVSAECAAAPASAKSSVEPGEAEAELIRAATAQILQAAEAEPIPDALRKIAAQLAEALQRQQEEGANAPLAGEATDELRPS